MVCCRIKWRQMLAMQYSEYRCSKGVGNQGCGLAEKTWHDDRSHDWERMDLQKTQAYSCAGIEAIFHAGSGIGLDRCTWKGLDHFKAYVMSSVLAYNLQKFARLSI